VWWLGLILLSLAGVLLVVGVMQYQTARWAMRQYQTPQAGLSRATFVEEIDDRIAPPELMVRYRRGQQLILAGLVGLALAALAFGRPTEAAIVVVLTALVALMGWLQSLGE